MWYICINMFMNLHIILICTSYWTSEIRSWPFTHTFITFKHLFFIYYIGVEWLDYVELLLGHFKVYWFELTRNEKKK